MGHQTLKGESRCFKSDHSSINSMEKIAGVDESQMLKTGSQTVYYKQDIMLEGRFCEIGQTKAFEGNEALQGLERKRHYH